MAILESQERIDIYRQTISEYAGLGGMSSDGRPTGNDPREDSGDLLLLEPKVKTKRPPLFKVIMHNDDYTPMDFVVEVLKVIFRMPHEDALNVMLQIHNKGAGLCGVFTRDVAETKVELVMARAREQEYPLQCTLERE